ncbi:Nif3-like dinuclear metal center hexameric protein [Enemella dayhoffiae]|uniref:GTP cyclohydrolase 1 type 2 homolog n=1 Tax=Enemella dayhoffiae TaxID=2016507 RepID=A0A255H0Q0_9ACTN|nr:Nif3-like dinuclear metal center hexameric protein [Enemella dayhoffiae]OYO20946.1 Nif3-like dinuclear metal center hexameric protein [Enemella dayhoffiae]
MTTLAEVQQLLDRHYPPRTAEAWDKVGVVCGDPSWPVTSVLLTVDITGEVVRQAVELGADLVITHHPLLLKGIHGIDGRHPKGALLLELAGHRIGCIAAHTNADIPPDGVCEALADAIGLREQRPLDPRDTSAALDQLVCFVPTEHTRAVVDALSTAGAGAIGDYDRCHFTSPGTGSFRPLEGANPQLGRVGEVERVSEDRLEMVLPRSRRGAVVAALLAAHPYEEPAFHVIELARTDSPTAGIGRVGTLEPERTAGEFAQQVANALPATVSGVRLGGDPQRVVRTVAVLAGAGDSHLDAARAAGADLYLTSDLRHHPATEALEWTDAPVLLDVAHWAAEWTWLPVLAGLITAAEPELRVRVSEHNTDAWAAAYHR